MSGKIQYPVKDILKIPIRLFCGLFAAVTVASAGAAAFGFFFIAAESIHDLYDTAELGTTDSVNEVAELIQELLSGESALTRDVVQMRIDGYSYYEIAAKHKISENSARVVYFRAKSKIRKYLEKEGFRYE